MDTFPHPDQYIDTKDLVKYTKISKRFWESRRLSGDSPSYIKIDRIVRYRWGDVVAWLEKQRISIT